MIEIINRAINAIKKQSLNSPNLNIFVSRHVLHGVSRLFTC